MENAVPDSMHGRLRAATWALHQRVESAARIDLRLSSVDHYKALLRCFHGLYRPVEAALADLRADDLGIELQSRRKTAWLLSDLRDLGDSEEVIASAPVCRSLPSLHGKPAALGWLYVIEGASLGGRIILRHAACQLGVGSSFGGRFFAGYGSETGLMWRAYLAELNAVHARSEIANQIEASAMQMFLVFEEWLGMQVAELEEERSDAGPFCLKFACRPFAGRCSAHPAGR